MSLKGEGVKIFLCHSFLPNKGFPKFNVRSPVIIGSHHYGGCCTAVQCSVSDRWETAPQLEKFCSLAKLSCVRQIETCFHQVTRDSLLAVPCLGGGRQYVVRDSGDSSKVRDTEALFDQVDRILAVSGETSLGPVDTCYY